MACKCEKKCVINATGDNLIGITIKITCYLRGMCRFHCRYTINLKRSYVFKAYFIRSN